MFTHDVPAADYADPWVTPFAERMATLRSERTRIAYYYHYPDNSTFRYRCYNMAQAVNALLPGVSAAHFSLEDGTDALYRAVAAADVLVVCRSRYTDKLNQLITRARGQGCRVIYDIDDLVFDPRYVHLVLDTLDQAPTDAAWDHWFAYIARLGGTMQLCDRVIVTNQQLVDRVHAFDPGKPARIIPNFMNREQVALSCRMHEAKRAAGFARSGPILIGYFSGTPTHTLDFQLVAPALARLLDGDPRLSVRLVGFMDVPPALQRHADRIDRLPLLDFVNLQRAMGETELNVVPLQDNLFTQCKSNLKYFEAGAAGTVTIATPTLPYAQSITDGVNGYLAQGHQWEAKIAQALDALDAYPALAQHAHEDSLARFAWTAQAAALQAALLDD